MARRSSLGVGVGHGIDPRSSTPRGYDYARCRAALRVRGIIARIARRGQDSSPHLGRHRWMVERTLAWLNRFRRLRVRYECRADIHKPS